LLKRLLRFGVHTDITASVIEPCCWRVSGGYPCLALQCLFWRCSWPKARA